MSPTENFGPIDEEARTAAADWFARLRGPDAEKAQSAFAAWYADPAHARAYEQLVGRWEQSAFIGSTRVGGDRQLRRASLLARRPGLAAAAAIAAIIGGVALFSGALAPRDARPDIAQDAGQRRYQSEGEVREITLSDGSRVTLDKASLLLVSYTPQRRDVRLGRGRARFEPARNASRPFIVHAGAGEIQADQAVFDVKLARGAAAVNAVDGQVSVRSVAQTTPARMVFARQQILVLNDAPLAQPEPSPAGAADWLPPMIVLDHTSLADAALQVARGANHKILFADEASALQITGTFKRGDTDGLARAAQSLFHLRRSRDSSGNILLSRGPVPSN